MKPLPEIIGESPAVLAVRRQVAQLLEHRSAVRRHPPVLILGETGTGKGLLARAVHAAGPRASGPFVSVNCAAIPETLLEAELFGYERGAFTDARHPKAGLFQTAHGGTLFLDEIGLLPAGLQAKLLTALEDRAVRRLGSTRSEPVDVWVVAAASEDLERAVRARRFRAELYHRLAVVTLRLPPLRERGRDVVILAEHLLVRACADYGLAPKALADDAREALLAYRWPGNVRELANVMERVALLAQAPVVTAAGLGLPGAQPAAGPSPEPSPPGDERARLLAALQESAWNVSRTAARLGLSRDAMRYRIQKYGLRPEVPGPAQPPDSPRPGAREGGVDPAVGRRLTPFVGRTLELAMLLERFAEVKAGRGQVVLVAGEPGIGKSRLVLQFRRALAEAGEDVTYLAEPCVAFGRSVPFQPVLLHLRKAFGIGDLDDEPEIIERIEGEMRRLGGLEPHVPYVRYLLCVDPGDPAIAAMEPAGRRRRIFEALRALALRRASLRPVVLVVEDLHWIDAASEEYLAYLADGIAGIRLMLLLTYRVGYAPPFGTRSFQTTITLRSLSESDAFALARGVLGGGELSEELKGTLWRRAEGVPLFIEEMSRALLESGMLRLDRGTCGLRRSVPVVGVPDTVQGVIKSRLDRLGEDATRVVQAASVIGREFSPRVLERAAGVGHRLDGALRELTALEIVHEKALLQGTVYVFKHAITQDVAYGSLSSERLRELHRAVGDTIEALHADRLADHYEELGRHFLAADEPSKAFEYLVRAGDRSKDAYADQAAAEWYDRALAVAERITPPLPPQRLARIYQQRSQVWLRLARYDEAIADAERVVKLARSSADRRFEGEALADMALVHWTTPIPREDAPEILEYAEEARRIAEEVGDQRILASSLTALGHHDQLDGRLLEADQKMEQALRIGEREGFGSVLAPSRAWLGAHAYWRGEVRKAVPLCIRAEESAAELHDGYFELLALSFRANALISLGEHARGLAVIDEGARKARDRGHGYFVGRLANTLGWLYQEVGDFRRALERNHEAADMGRRIRNANVEVSSLFNVAHDYVSLGEPARALPILEDLGRQERRGFGVHRWRLSSRLATCLAEALLAMGREEEALVHAERGLAQARATGSMKYVGRALALRGEIALRAGDAEGAMPDLEEALRIARDIEHPTLVWQGAHLLSRAHAARDEVDAAYGAARLASETIDAVAARLPEGDLRRAFLAWPMVQAVREHLDRLRRG